jgi:DNA-binding LytR/AlgR family response regulator
MTLNCAIIDDEPLAVELLESYVAKTPYLNLIGSYTNTVNAIHDLRENRIDVIYLDIQMPNLSGLEFAKIIPSTTKVILTTAFPQYAIEGYKVNAIDYLLKPISYEEFVRSTDKVMEWATQVHRQDSNLNDRTIYVKTDYKLQQLSLDDILYVENYKDYVHFHMRNGERMSTKISMRRLEEFLPSPEFMRVHRSFVVRMPEVRTIERGNIVFGDLYVPITDKYMEEVQRYLDQRTLG